MRVVVLGDAGSGKTSLISRLTSKTPAVNDVYHPTIATEIIQCLASGRTYYDFSGQERFSWAPTDGGMCCVLVVDLCGGDLERLSYWHDEYLQFASVSASFIVVGTKSDIHHRCISECDLVGWAGKIPFAICSAVSGDGIDSVDKLLASVEVIPISRPLPLVAYDIGVEVVLPVVNTRSSEFVFTTTFDMVGASVVLFRLPQSVQSVDEIKQLKTRFLGCSQLKSERSLVCIVVYSVGSEVLSETMRRVIEHEYFFVLPIGIEFTRDCALHFFRNAHATRKDALLLERSALNSRCDFADCSWEGPLITSEEHFRRCPKRLICCRFEGCNAKFRMENRSRHELACVFQPALCPYCATPCVSLNEHLSECPNRYQHISEHCKCPLGVFGCTAEEIPRVDLETHLSSRHMGFVANGLSHVLSESRSSASEVLRVRSLLEIERRRTNLLENKLEAALKMIESLTGRLEYLESYHVLK